MTVDIDRMKKASKAVYLACEESVADDISGMFRGAAAEIERLTERCEAYKGQVKAGSDEIERLRASLATARRALELALPYLDNSDSPGGCDGRHQGCSHCAAIAAARAALTPSPDSAGVEPVAWRIRSDTEPEWNYDETPLEPDDHFRNEPGFVEQPLYARAD